MTRDPPGRPTPDNYVELTRVLRRKEAEGLVFTLQNVGIQTHIAPSRGNNGQSGLQWVISVRADKLDRAQKILEEEAVGLAPVIPLPQKPPALYWAVGLVVLNVVVWIAMESHSGGSEAISTLSRFGASQAPLVLGGAWWRLITAVFLHVGLKHLLGNMFTLSLFGPPVLRQWGVGRFYFMYLLTGVAGNLVSLALSPTRAFKAGASGAILGLLGVLAGARIRAIRSPGPPSRFKTWHIVAMIVAFYGFVVGVGPADHLAHLGGLLAGILFGLFMPDRVALLPRTDRLVSLACGALATGLALAAGLLQYFK